MTRSLLSRSAGALMRCLLQRAGNDRNRILLSSWLSVDWQSLTFVGERHQASFRLTGPDAMALARRWTDGIEDAELDVGKGLFVAELAVSGRPVVEADGSVIVSLEALTLAD